MESYKSLIVWQKASEFSLAVLEAVDEGWTARAGGIFEQLRRAAVSVDISIVEGYALNTLPFFRSISASRSDPRQNVSGC